jgi:polyhydroxybutyrate depolymerase
MAQRQRLYGVLAAIVVIAGLALGCRQSGANRAGTAAPPATADTMASPAAAASGNVSPSAATAATGTQPAIQTGAGAAPAGARQAPAGTQVEEIAVGGQMRRYRLHVPPSYQPGRPTPLVLNLPGYGETALEQELLSGMSPAADAAGFIVVYPEGEGSPAHWDIGPGNGGVQEVAYFRALLDRLEQDWSLDPRRVFATGISNGGGMVNRLACDLADRIAAIAPVSGDYQFYKNCSPGRAVPVIAFHGTADKLVPYQGSPSLALPPIRDWAAAWAVRNGCAAGPREAVAAPAVRVETWEGCREDATVALYTIDGGGHTWPRPETAPRQGGSVDGTALIWSFFAAHPHP